MSEPTEAPDAGAVFTQKIIDTLKAIRKEIKLTYAMARKPKRLVLKQYEAEAVNDLFMSGSSPEDIGRAMKNYGEKPYFKVINEAMDGLEYGAVDFDIQGLEYMRSAMIRLGALKTKGRYDYYNSNHPMVKKIAEIAGAVKIEKTIKGAY